MMKPILFALHLFIVAPLSLWAEGGLINLRQLEDLPIQHEGRNKPFFTLARESVVFIHGSEQYQPSFGLRPWSPVEIGAALWFAPKGWENERWIQVTHKGLRQETGLEESRRYFSFDELVRNTKLVAMIDEITELRRREERPKLTREQQEASNVSRRLTLFASMTNGSLFTAIPVALPQAGLAPAWITPVQALAEGQVLGSKWQTMQQAFVQRDSAAFDQALQVFRSHVREIAGGAYPDEWLISLEHLYAVSHPFRWAWIACALSAAVLIATGKNLRRGGYAIGWALAGVALALMIFGFFCRSAIAGRPPVTNMYESVIWVGFGCLVFGMVLERIYRCRYFLVAALPAAMVSLYLADSAPQIMDPAIHPLQPVLQDNFWLTTHVLTITLSYAAFLLALALAHIVLGKALLGRDIRSLRPLYNYLYRSIQIGVLLLATGVVLGAFWANYSWGRFWDWDPKETWSLVALLGYIFLLHGRIAGWWGGFGLAVGSVFSFLAILMAWYGVNFVLGVGLHSYGFGTGGFGYVITFVVAETLFVVAALVRYGITQRHAKQHARVTHEPSPAT